MGMYFGAPLSVGEYIWKGMIPVTLGNIVGGGFFVGTVFWYLYIFRHSEGSSIGGVVVERMLEDGPDTDTSFLKCKCHHHHYDMDPRGREDLESGTFPNRAVYSGGSTPMEMTILEGQSRAVSPDRSASTQHSTTKQKTVDDIV